MIDFFRIIVCALAGRYVAPEVFRNEEYDTKVDVFSFALILQEVMDIIPSCLNEEYCFFSQTIFYVDFNS